MEEILKKRYLLEKGYNEGLIDDTKFGDIDYANLICDLKKVLSYDENFSMWLRSFANNKRELGHKMRLANAISCKGMTEVSETAKITACLNRCKDDQTITMQAGVGKIQYMPTIKPGCHLIMGGIFPNQLEMVAQIVESGSFSIGYYGKTELPYTKYVFEQLNLLKEQIIDSYGEQIQNLYENKKEYIEEKNSVYMIKYNAEPIYRPYEHSKTIPSQR